MHTRISFVFFMICTILFGTAWSQEQGDRVMVTAQFSNLRDDVRLLARLPRGTLLNVLAVDGAFLVVEHRGVVGRVSKVDVIALDRALEFIELRLARRKTPEDLAVRGVVHAAFGRFPQAMQDLEEALSLDPSNMQIRVQRVTIRMEYNDIDGALADASELIERAPEDASTHALRGIIWMTKENWREATADLTEALRRDAELISARVNRATAYERLEQWDEALEDVEWILNRMGGYVPAIAFKGELLIRRGDHADAILWYSTHLDQSPSAPLYAARAQAYVAVQNFRGAVEDYQKALALMPDEPMLLNNLAWLLATCPDDSVRNGQMAIGLARRACELTQWSNAGIIDTLAAAWAEVGDFPQALVLIERAIGTGSADETTLEKLKSHQQSFLQSQPIRMPAPSDSLSKDEVPLSPSEPLPPPPQNPDG